MRDTIFPVYVVMDFSESMSWKVDSKSEKCRIDVATEIIPTLLGSMRDDASVAETLRLRVIGFNQGVIFSTELYDYYSLKGWYINERNTFKSKCKGQTWYGSAFKCVHECIETDINHIKRDGKEYYRPLIYFLTDGKPEGEDKTERDALYQELVDNDEEHTNPVILCVGIGPEDMSELIKYGAARTSKNGKYVSGNKSMTFSIKDDVRIEDGLKELNSSVIGTITYSLQQRESDDKKFVNEIDPKIFDENLSDEKASRLFERMISDRRLS